MVYIKRKTTMEKGLLLLHLPRTLLCMNCACKAQNAIQHCWKFLLYPVYLLKKAPFSFLMPYLCDEKSRNEAGSVCSQAPEGRIAGSTWYTHFLAIKISVAESHYYGEEVMGCASWLGWTSESITSEMLCCLYCYCRKLVRKPDLHIMIFHLPL